MIPLEGWGAEEMGRESFRMPTLKKLRTDHDGKSRVSSNYSPLDSLTFPTFSTFYTFRTFQTHRDSAAITDCDDESWEEIRIALIEQARTRANGVKIENLSSYRDS